MTRYEVTIKNNRAALARSTEGGKEMATKKAAKRYVVVATKSRPWSILAGELVAEGADSVTLAGARMIAYFTSESRSLVGVAAIGVTVGARVSPRIDEGTFFGIEQILDATDKARESIEAEPWG